MGKIIYVDGNILVKTRYFKSKNEGAFYDTPPEDAEVWKPNKKDKEGNMYFEINDNNPQSMFNEYYAKEEFATYDNWVSYLYATLDEVHDQYVERIKDINNLIRIDCVNDKQKGILNKLYFISVITYLDAFICDTILTIITSDESTFERYFNSIPCNQIKVKMEDLKKQNSAGILEQKVVHYVLRQSYSNIKTIKDFFKDFFKIKIEDKSGRISEYFEIRHKLVHRNGRDKDGNYIEIPDKDLETLIKDINDFVDQIMSKISK